jgi:redox-sensitive bicupin YhaK (pirin superfamily)
MENTLLRKSNERGTADFGWLQAKYSFSFSSYFDERWMGFGDLRVINQDRIGAAQGFGTHPHKDMEILTLVLSGAIAHKDSLGNEAIIKPGEIQVMTAGKGIFHSEFNPLKNAETHLLQIWIETDTHRLPPSYSQVNYQENLKPNELNLLASKKGPSIINQDAHIYLAPLGQGRELHHQNDHRSFWVQVIRGELQVNHHTLSEGDGCGLRKEKKVHFKALADCEFLFFDLRET